MGLEPIQGLFLYGYLQKLIVHQSKM